MSPDLQVARRALIPDAIAYPEDLPITAWREELVDAIREHQVLIVAGETGSGKSTQLPKLCLEAGRGVQGRIGHTQPRRIAARSIAERVASELGGEVGGLVGYTVRFTDQVAESTAVKLMTDGILLNELQHDRDLRQYDTIIIDEAHERSLNVDFLLGYLKQLLPRRPDLRVIVTSATIDTARFSGHFDDAPVFEVEGRTYPVEVRYRPLDGGKGRPRDQTTAICDAVQELAVEGTGDTLVFCSGEREIADAVDALSDLGLRHTEVLPLFGRLSAAEQHRVFSGHTGRRIVVATNVAETSLTVPGIRYVVDTGYARISRYSRRTKVQQLPIEAVSRASADQRAGRCGRLGPGIAIRLYDEPEFEARPEFTDPEILRTNLSAVMLQMAAIGLGPVTDFPFIDPPDTRTVKDGISTLQELGAIGDGSIGTREWLTPTGRALARLPLDPRLGRMLLAGHENGCLSEVLTIASALAIQDPRERPKDKEDAADQRHSRFRDPSSDFMSWLKLWDFVSSERRQRSSAEFRRMCRNEFLHWRRLREWQDLRAQLRRVARDLGMRETSSKASPETVHASLLAGLLSHVGQKNPNAHTYRGARGTAFSIHPGSSLFKTSPEWVMAAELFETSRTWAAGVTAVDPATVASVGAHLVKTTISDPWWDPERGAAVCRETVTLYGLTLSTDRIVLYNRFDPAGARSMFIMHALVAAEWDTHHRFAAQNAETIQLVLDAEARERRADLLVTDDALAGWFEAKVPYEVTSAAAFDAWWKAERARNPGLLTFSHDDVIDPHASAINDDDFPRVWSYGDINLDVSYEFDPASEDDGVTIDVPIAAIDRIDPTVFEGNVPGLRLEVITALIRSLPKSQRKLFAPVPDTATAIAPAVEASPDALLQTLARILTARAGIVVRPDDFDVDTLPAHVLPRFRVVTETGEVLAEGGDFTALRERLRREARHRVETSSHDVEHTGSTSWDFDDLPESLLIGEGVTAVRAYPSIVDEGDTVGVRLLATQTERDEATWAGVRRLLILSLPAAGRLLQGTIGPTVRLNVVGGPYPSTDAFAADVLGCAVDAVMIQHGRTVRTKEGFEALFLAVRDDLADLIDTVGRQGATMLGSHRELLAQIDRTPKDAFSDVLDDIEQQTDRFLFDGCLTAVGAGRVDDLRRYLDGATYRLQRVAEDTDRDRNRMSLVHDLEQELDDLSEVLAITEDLVAVAWMIQELRISLFAQPIGVQGKVSEQRVRSALKSLLSASA